MREAIMTVKELINQLEFLGVLGDDMEVVKCGSRDGVQSYSPAYFGVSIDDRTGKPVLVVS